MKTIIQIMFFFMLAACANRKAVHDAKNELARDLEKAIRQYEKRPSDSSLANQVMATYERREMQLKASISSLEFARSPQEKENHLQSLIALQQLYDLANGHKLVRELVAPGSVKAEIERSRLEVTTAYLSEAEKLVAEDYWRSARIAQGYLKKVDQWKPVGFFADTRELMRVARQAAILDALVLPVGYETFTYNYNNTYNGAFSQRTPLSDLIVRDLYSTPSGSTGSSLRVYTPWQAEYRKVDIDVIIEPVWIQLQGLEPRRYTRVENRSRQIQTSTDTSGRPIYKTVTAVLHITEEVYDVSGRLELRISDYAKRSEMATRSWYESEQFTNTYGHYQGSSEALSEQDWALINHSNRGNFNRFNAVTGEDILLQKMYPDLINWLRNELR